MNLIFVQIINHKDGALRFGFFFVLALLGCQTEKVALCTLSDGAFCIFSIAVNMHVELELELLRVSIYSAKVDDQVCDCTMSTAARSPVARSRGVFSHHRPFELLCPESQVTL